MAAWEPGHLVGQAFSGKQLARTYLPAFALADSTSVGG
jgi:hypothetical protein